LKKIGLTGGIGSGKSYIAMLFEALQVPVFYADLVAREILNDPTILNQVSEALDTSIVDVNTGLADRKKIASLVFSAPEKLMLLNQIIHPAVEAEFIEWCTLHEKHHYVLKEAAILFESGSYKNLDSVICVLAPLALRLKRVTKRDQQSEAEILKRINNQWSDEQRMNHANWLINNDEQHPLLEQVLAIHNEIITQ
jgi:dephospho-CoA kinase